MPIPSLLQTIIAKVLVLVDHALTAFATTTGGGAVIADPANPCGISQMYANVTPCGTSLIGSIDTLIVQGVGLLSGMITALGAYDASVPL